jgi:hypothetical protein
MKVLWQRQGAKKDTFILSHYTDGEQLALIIIRHCWDGQVANRGFWSTADRRLWEEAKRRFPSLFVNRNFLVK